MLIDKYVCYCSSCNSKQVYYHFSSASNRADITAHMDNQCSECGCNLSNSDVPDFENIEIERHGACGENGIT